MLLNLTLRDTVGKIPSDSEPEMCDADRQCHFLALAVDMTARNMQEEVKKKGLPWSAVKGFDTFTPIGSVFPSVRRSPYSHPVLRKFIPKSSVSDAHHLRLALKVTSSDLHTKGHQLIPHTHLLTDQWCSQTGWYHRRHDFPYSETH